jgi:hypothetical protein
MRLVQRGTLGVRSSFPFVIRRARACRRAGPARRFALRFLPLLLTAGVACAQAAAPPADAPAAAAAAPTASTSIWDAPEPWRTDRFYLETSVYTHHFSYDPAHNDHQNLILGEWNITENWLAGAAVFDNSFGQSSQFVYGGVRMRPFENLQPLYFKLALGIVHGYSGEYQNKIPMNNSGFAPIIIPSVGYCINRFCSEFVVFGTAGAMVTVGVTIP